MNIIKILLLSLQKAARGALGCWRTGTLNEAASALTAFSLPGSGRGLHPDLYTLGNWGYGICVSPVLVFFVFWGD